MLSVCLDVNQSGTSRSRCRQKLLILLTHICQWSLITHKTRSVWPTLRVKVARRRKRPLMGIFKPAEPHSPRDACVCGPGRISIFAISCVQYKCVWCQPCCFFLFFLWRAKCPCEPNWGTIQTVLCEGCYPFSIGGLRQHVHMAKTWGQDMNLDFWCVVAPRPVAPCMDNVVVVVVVDILCNSRMCTVPFLFHRCSSCPVPVLKMWSNI